MTFWKTVLAVIVANVITALISFLLLSAGLSSVLSGTSDQDSTTVDIPDRVDF